MGKNQFLFILFGAFVIIGTRRLGVKSWDFYFVYWSTSRCRPSQHKSCVCFHADNKQFSRSFEHVGEIELSHKTQVEIAELFTSFALTNYSRVISVLSEDRVKQENLDNRVGPIEESLSEQRPIVVACRKSLSQERKAQSRIEKKESAAARLRGFGVCRLVLKLPVAICQPFSEREQKTPFSIVKNKREFKIPPSTKNPPQLKSRRRRRRVDQCDVIIDCTVHVLLLDIVEHSRPTERARTPQPRR